MEKPSLVDPDVALVLERLIERCPRLLAWCYWAGTAAIAAEELGHRRSFDLDFHTTRALVDVRPILAELERAFAPGQVQLVQLPDEFGSAFRAVVRIDGAAPMPIEVLSNYEDVDESDLVPSRFDARLRRVALGRYLADKVQCVAERAEARDLIDILAVLRHDNRLRGRAERLVGGQDQLLLAERLLHWTRERLAADLEAYDGVSVDDAIVARDLLLSWVAPGSHDEA